MVDEITSFHLFESYLTLSLKIKETSIKGDFDLLEDLLEKREDCQEQMGLVVEKGAGATEENALTDLLEILYRAKDVNEEIFSLLVEKREVIEEALETIQKGQYVSSSYRNIKNSSPGGSFIDERS